MIRKTDRRRPRPMTPKAGFTLKKRRYGCGGRLKK